MDSVEFESNLIQEFNDFGIDIDGNLIVLEKLTEICNQHSLKADQVVSKWVGYAMKCKEENITAESLEEFQKDLKKNEKGKSRKSAARNKTTYNIHTIRNIDSQDENGENDILQSYATTPQGKEVLKRQHVTPEETRYSKKLAGINSTPISQTFSPRSLPSPAMSTPSAKYESRSGRGDAIVSFGIPDKATIAWKGCARSVNIENFDETCNVVKPYKYMFQKLQDKADILNDMITSLAEQMKQKFNIKEFENIWTQTQEDISLSGRICCDSVGRINSKSVVLEGSKQTSAGQRLPIDLSELKNYSLFPGQIVSMAAKNVTGGVIIPSAINSGTRLPFLNGSQKNRVINTDPFTMYIACGPYATCSDKATCYAPLDDLCKVIKTEVPDVVLMLGPFVDIKQPLIENGEIDDTFDDLFLYCQTSVNAILKNIGTKVVFIPSQRDAFHHYVYPQPPFEVDTNSGSKIQMLSDPCTLMVNDICLGITSTDILFHLGAEEVSSFNIRSDRLGRLANHLLLQQCYYPLHPTSEDVNLDYEQFESHCFMPVTPDILILPSDLRYFIKDVDGCLCLNPGRVVKGETGGSYIKMMVKPNNSPNSNTSSAIKNSIVQVIRL